MGNSHTTIIKSLGIDIGTTTTQFVISRLTVKNVAPGTLTPKMEITDKEVIYKSKIHFTPIAAGRQIDAEKLAALIAAEFAIAGVQPGEIETGAVIITGETAKKENARRIAHRIAGFAGEFVVAAAGGKLEAIIAGKGSGAADYSRDHYCVAVNIDIGGGTTNIGVFQHGAAIDSCCLNVGGRLLRIDPHTQKITEITEPMRAVMASLGITTDLAQAADLQQVEAICAAMAQTIQDCLQSPQPQGLARRLLMTEPLRLDYPLDVIMVSGGVADYVYGAEICDTLLKTIIYGDIGPMLGKHVKQWLTNFGPRLIKPTETIRATVIGAGAQTVDVSGSTILVEDSILPLKNIPIAMPFTGPIPIREDAIRDAVRRSLESFMQGDAIEPLAVGIPGQRPLSFANIQILARGLYDGWEPLLNAGLPLIVVLEADMAKALGQSFKALNGNTNIICIDQLVVKEGDYIDIGKSIAGGTVVPVVIKSLIFETRQV